MMTKGTLTHYAALRELGNLILPMHNADNCLSICVSFIAPQSVWDTSQKEWNSTRGYQVAARVNTGEGVSSCCGPSTLVVHSSNTSRHANQTHHQRILITNTHTLIYSQLTPCLLDDPRSVSSIWTSINVLYCSFIMIAFMVSELNDLDKYHHRIINMLLSYI